MAVKNVMDTHHTRMWDGDGTKYQYNGIAQQLRAAGSSSTLDKQDNLFHAIMTQIYTMGQKIGVNYISAIYLHPDLVPIIVDQVHPTSDAFHAPIIVNGIRINVLNTPVGPLPLIPDPYIDLGMNEIEDDESYNLPLYILSESLIEYHWLGSMSPRIYRKRLGEVMKDYFATEWLVNKIGTVLVNAAYCAHHEILVPDTCC